MEKLPTLGSFATCSSTAQSAELLAAQKFHGVCMRQESLKRMYMTCQPSGIGAEGLRSLMQRRRPQKLAASFNPETSLTSM